MFGRALSVGIRKAAFFPIWNGQARAVWISAGGGRRPVLDKSLELGDEIEPIHGVWDLLMIEDTPRAVERLYHRMTGGPEAQPDVGDGIIVASPDGKFARLQVAGEQRDSRRYHINNYRLAHDLPQDGVLVVRTAALMEFTETRRRAARDSTNSINMDFEGISEIIPALADELVDQQAAFWQREGQSNPTRREVATAFAEKHLHNVVKGMVDSGALATANGRPEKGEFLCDARWGVTKANAELLRNSLPRDLPTELWSTVNEKADEQQRRRAQYQAQESAKRAAGLYTILEAWQALSHATGITATRWRQTMLRDIRSGKLPLRNPQNPADRLPYEVPLELQAFYDQVDAQSLNKWLNAHPDWSVSYRFPVGDANEKKTTDRECGEPLSVRERQGREIVRVIRELGRDPKALPKGPSGKEGIKAQVRAHLDFTKSSFDHSWKWLRETGAIEDES